MPDKIRIDWFLADVVNVEIDLTPELMGALIEAAIRYKQAGGTITWEKYSLLSDASRLAFEAAEEKMKSPELAK